MNKLALGIILVLVILLFLLLWYGSYTGGQSVFGLWYDDGGKCGLQEAYVFTRVDGAQMVTEYRTVLGSNVYNNTYSLNGEDTLVIFGTDSTFPWTIKFNGDTAILTKKNVAIKLVRLPKQCA